MGSLRLQSTFVGLRLPNNLQVPCFLQYCLPVLNLVPYSLKLQYLLAGVLAWRFVCKRSHELCAFTLLLRLSSRLNFIHCRPLIGSLDFSVKMQFTIITSSTVNQLFHNFVAFTLSPSVFISTSNLRC